MPAPTPPIVVSLNLEKATKGTFRYASVERNAPVETLYVTKTAFPDDPPPKLRLTLTAE